ncbi:MAG: glycosyl transferase family protein [Acidobacteria bacterium OLB17]|nr:MAG: glycosyl transferase family protein [Acidobacteria bacterium OLB17]MCZ2390388.1 glycosyltransferase family 4 protein [Acidobacteriota bacterium]
MKVLITAPSLRGKENVSGISTLVSDIIRLSDNEYVHFRAGRRDGVPKSAKWIAKQPKMVLALREAIRRERPDIIHLNTSFSRLAMLRDAVLIRAAAGMGVPIVLHIHGGPYFLKDEPGPVLRRCITTMMKYAARVIVLSEQERDVLAKRYGRGDADVLANAVPMQEAAERAEEKSPRSIIFFGRLNREKGLSRIVDACRGLVERNIPFRFNAYGAGPDAESFLAEMRAVCGERFTFGGVADGGNKWQALAENDIFLLPSDHEGLPIALLEAMAAGCVPVVRRNDAIAAAVAQGEAGFVVDINDKNEIVDRLAFLLDEGRDLAPMRQKARQTIADGYSFGQYLSRLDEIYKKALAR